MSKIISILLVLISLISCESYQHISGTIVDADTEKPLKGVSIYLRNKTDIKTTTDSLGNFELSNISKGINGKSMKVVIEHNYYKKIEAKISIGNNEILKMNFDYLNGYAERWNYFDLKETIKMEIISHSFPKVGCGVRDNASVTIGKIASGDTIRVLEYCNNKKDFKKGDLVKVFPAKHPNSYVPLATPYFKNSNGNVYLDNFEYQILNTTYGTIEIDQ